MPYKYFFYIDTPNLRNCYGPVLSTPYYLYTSAEGNQIWRPGNYFYAAPQNVFDYLAFARSKGFFIFTLIEVVGKPDDTSVSSFHKELFQDGRQEGLRHQALIRTLRPTPSYKVPLWDLRYCASENLTDFRRFPFAPPKPPPYQPGNISEKIKYLDVAAIYTPE